MLQLRRQQYPVRETPMIKPVQALPETPSKPSALATQYFWRQKAGSRTNLPQPYQDIQRRQTLDTRHSSREKSLPAPSTSQVGFFPVIGKPKFNLQEALICVTKLNWAGSTSTQSLSLQKKSFDTIPQIRDKPPPKTLIQDASTKSTTSLLSSFRF